LSELVDSMSALFPFRSLGFRCAQALAGLVLSASGALAQEPPTVAASIQPLQLIAAAVTDGVSEPVLALGAGQDPHEISLRPSERRALADADLVLWVGPALELPLVEILEGEADKLLTAQDVPGLRLLPAGNDNVDPHLWLSLGNAQKVAQALAVRLSALDPANAARYDENQQRFAAALATARANAQRQLQAAWPQAWAVYHHAFRYIQDELQLPPALALTDGNGSMAGLRTLIGLREEMHSTGLSCLVAEPGVEATKVRSLLDMPQLRVQVVDIMGTQQTLDAAAYARMYATLIDAIVDCATAGNGDSRHDD
jgi:zinc transport system substrate-binding protein